MANTSIIKVDTICLYTGDNVSYGNGVITGQSSDTISITGWLSNNNISYQHLNYADANQHVGVFTPVSTWFASSNTNVNTFPFIVYDTVDSTYTRARNIIIGANNIVSSNLSVIISTAG
jgi:hypothetical protein